MDRLPPTQERLVRQALARLRKRLLPVLSASQREIAQGVVDCLEPLIAPSASTATGGPSRHPPRTLSPDALHHALGRLDACIDDRLKSGRLDTRSRTALRRQLDETARTLSASIR